MASERMKTNLDGAAIVAAYLVNIHRTKGSRPVSPLELHPLRQEDRRQRGGNITLQTLDDIGDALVAVYGKNK